MRDLVELKVSDPVADTFIINSGAPTSSRTVTLNSNVTKEEDALEMRFRNYGFSWSVWESYSGTKSWTLPTGDGVKTVYAEYRDQGHNTVSMINNITLDTGAPAGPGFYVWGTGTEAGQIHDFVNTQSCSLFMNVAGADRMRFSNSSVANNTAAWDAVSSTEAYSDNHSWTLSAGDGIKTVYSQFLDAADNDSYFTYNITLDTTDPSVSSFMINNDDATANSIAASLTYNYSETNEVWAEYKNDGESWSSRESLSGSSENKSWTLKAVTGTRTVSARLTDIAGNVSIYSDDIFLDNAAPPAPVVTAVTPINDTTPEWTWNDVPGASYYQYNLNNTFWSEPVNFRDYTAPPLTPNTSHTLYVRAVDSEGRESESGSSAVYIDMTEPAIIGTNVISNNPNSSYAKEGDTISISFDAVDDASGLSSTDVTFAGSSLSVAFIGGTTYTANYTCHSGTPEGPISPDISVTDGAGNLSVTVTGPAVTIDRTAPIINNFRVNNGNTYSCSPQVRLTSDTPESDITMNITGTASSGMIPYSSTYDLNAASGSVTGIFYDLAGNTRSSNDTITVQSSAADIRYENQSLPSHLSSSAYNLGTGVDWDIHGGDYAEGSLNTDLSGNATLWDEDWYRLQLDIGYSPRITVDLSVAANVIVEAFYDQNETQPVPISSYNVSPDGRTLDLQLNWDLVPDGVRTIWIKVRSTDGNYTGVSYDMTWYIAIL